MIMNLYRVFVTVTLVALATVSATADSTQIVLKADRLLDVNSGKIISPASLVIEGDKIVAVNPASLPIGAKVIDLGDKTLLPGLIDVHTHITSGYPDDTDWIHAAVTRTPLDDVLLGVKNAKVTLDAGFTTIRDLGSNGFSDVALMRAIHNGIIDGPDIFPSAHALSITGGHCDVTGLVPGVAERGPKQGVSNGKEEVLKAIRYQIKHGAKAIKICATAGVLSMGGPVGSVQYSDEELKVIVEEVHRQEIKVAAHAHSKEGIIAAVNAGVDSIEHGTIMDKNVAKLMKKKGSYLVPTVYLIESFDFAMLPRSLHAKANIVGDNALVGLKLAIDQNVPIAYGTDAGVFPHGDNGKQFGTFVRYGMSPIEAIRTATINAAELLNTKDRGQLKNGFRADIIAVSGNPLKAIETLESVSFVMKAGTVYSQK